MATKQPKKKKTEGNQDFFKRCVDSLTGQGITVRDAAAMCSAQFEQPSGLKFHKIDSPLEFDPAVDPSENEQEERGFLIKAKTGDPIDQWYGKLVINLSGVRFEPKMPVLRSHNRDRIVGTGEGFVKDQTVFVEGLFSQVTQDAAEVLALADEGFPWQASIGVWAEEISFLESGAKKTINGLQIDGPAEIWERSYIREVSFTPIGADERTAAIPLEASTDDSRQNLSSNSKEAKIMNLDDLKQDHPELFEEVTQAAKAEGITLGIGQERARVTEILEADAPKEVTLKAIENGTEAGEAYKEFYIAEKQNRGKGLQELENEATPPQGQEASPDGSGDESPKAFMELAKEIQENEKISSTAAMKKAVRLYPEEHKQFLKQNRKTRDDGRD